MPVRPHTARREASDELAELLASAGGLHGARLMQLLRLVDEPAPKTTAQAPVAPSGPRAIGIWQPRSRDGSLVFEREAPDKATSLLWDPRSTLVADKPAGTRRICLLGESAAAGWFYAPNVTPALVLQNYLGELAGQNRYEVVNLARIDLDAPTLIELASASLQLDPDALVIYAGNNWGVHFTTAARSSTINYHAAARAYRTEGPAGIMRLTTEAVRTDAESTMASLAAAVGRVPVIMVVPEVNLAEWERARPVPWLRGDGTPRWYATLARAKEAARREEWPAAIDAARELIAIDGGCCSTSQRLLATALAATGDTAAAREAARSEVTARLWDNHPHTPSASPAIQDAIRAGAAKHGFRCVDLPALSDAAGIRLPGRELMLDYCHLTLEGIGTTMRAVAAEVLSVDAVRDVRVDRLASPSAPPVVDARARFLAALYTTHWNSRRDGPASAWIAESLATWPAIADEMRAYASTRCVPPEWIRYSIAQQHVRALGADAEGRVLAGTSMDVHAVDAIRRALDGPGEVASLAMDADKRNLLDDAYLWSVLDRYEATGAFSHERLAFHRAIWPVSRFALPATATRSVALDVTARLPTIDGPRSGEATVAINGRVVATLALRERWRSQSVSVPSGALVAGVNRVSIRWPPIPAEGDAATRAITRRLELGAPTDLHPTFGQLFRLDVRTV